MAKRKKYPKSPNGYGQIRFLGKGRRNPYGVYPPADLNRLAQRLLSDYNQSQGIAKKGEKTASFQSTRASMAS